MNFWAPWSSSPRPWLSLLSTDSWFPKLLEHTVRTGFPLQLPSSSQPGTDQPPAGTPRRLQGAAAEDKECAVDHACNIFVIVVLYEALVLMKILFTCRIMLWMTLSIVNPM